MTEPTSIATELAAMKRIAGALEPLDPVARERVITWAYDRYHESAVPPHAEGTPL